MTKSSSPTPESDSPSRFSLVYFTTLSLRQWGNGSIIGVTNSPFPIFSEATPRIA